MSTVGEYLKTKNPTISTSEDNYKLTYGSGKKIEWKCLVCENVWEAKVYNISINLSGCPKCSRKKSGEKIRQIILKKCKSVLSDHLENLSERKIEFIKLINPEQDINEIPSNSEQKAEWKCLECEKIWVSSLFRVLKKLGGCPQCSYEKGMKTHHKKHIEKCKSVLSDHLENLSERKIEFIKLLNKDWKVNEITSGASQKGEWKCLVCFKIWNATVNNIVLRSKGCPTCKNKTEKIIIEELENEGFNFIKEAKYDWCKHKDFLRFDFVITDTKSDRIVFLEVDGQQHFSDVNCFKRNYDTNERDIYKMKCVYENHPNKNVLFLRVEQDNLYRNFKKYYKEWITDEINNFFNLDDEKIEKRFTCRFKSIKKDLYKNFENLDFV